MKQSRFEEQNEPLWNEYRTLVTFLDNPPRGKARQKPPPLERFPGLYRTLCAHYALARTRGYSPGLIQNLHGMIRRGYRHFYRRRQNLLRQGLRLMGQDFPRTLRRHALLFALAAGLLFLPMLAMGLASHQDDSLIYSIMDSQSVAQLESMYDPANRLPGRTAERESDTDFEMFGFYIMNNIGIGFRCFATGLLLGIGSVLLLVFNGLNIGAAAGHLTQLGYGETFWPFVSGHSAFELTAIAICGCAGLLLGKSLLRPGARTRLAALRANARDAVLLVGGGALLLTLAALIEAFWSAGDVPHTIKYGVGAANWAVLILYLTLAGRGGSHGS